MFIVCLKQTTYVRKIEKPKENGKKNEATESKQQKKSPQLILSFPYFLYEFVWNNIMMF